MIKEVHPSVATYSRFEKLIDEAIPLVDGDAPGRGYIAELIGLENPPSIIFNIGHIRELEDLISWVVDEFQDCEGALLDIIKKLSNCGSLFMAADDFQKLNNSFDCPATEWLSEALELNHLDKVWRTNDGKILDSAKALRTNEATKNGVDVHIVPAKDIAAYIILSNMLVFIPQILLYPVGDTTAFPLPYMEPRTESLMTFSFYGPSIPYLQENCI